MGNSILLVRPFRRITTNNRLNQLSQYKRILDTRLARWCFPLKRFGTATQLLLRHFLQVCLILLTITSHELCRRNYESERRFSNIQICRQGT